MKAENISQVHGFHKKLPNMTASMQEQIVSMYEILSLKYDQVPNFKKALHRLARKRRIPCDSTRNCFWACGVDLADVGRHSYEELRDSLVTGNNFLGCIMCVVYALNTKDFYWRQILPTLPETLQDGFEMVNRILAEEGLIPAAESVESASSASVAAAEENVRGSECEQCPVGGRSFNFGQSEGEQQQQQQ